MQVNWDDLRILLALYRNGSLNAAGRRLGLDDTTVSRRIKALERSLGETLVVRGPGGRYGLTREAMAVVEHAEAMASEVEDLANAHAMAGGSVRLTTVPVLAHRWLLPRVTILRDAFPDLTLALIADNRSLSLNRREADLALRLGRPATGGRSVVTRKLGRIAFAPYRAVGVDGDLPWIGYEDGMAHLAQAEATQTLAKRGGAAMASVRVHDAEMALEAAAAGLGIALLPAPVADRDPRLVARGAVALERELWLAGHRDLMRRPRVRAVIGWIEDTLASVGD